MCDVSVFFDTNQNGANVTLLQGTSPREGSIRIRGHVMHLIHHV